MPRCAVCRHAEAHIDDLACHRYPPTVIDTLEGSGSLWPAVAPDDWCGEWAAVIDPRHPARG